MDPSSGSSNDLREAAPRETATPLSVVPIEDEGSLGESGRQRSTSEIRFPDGEVVEVVWRRRPLLRYGDADSINNFDKLSEAALDGDGASAFRLKELITGCETAPQSDSELAAIVDQLQQTHTFVPPGSDEPVRFHRAEDVAIAIEQRRSSYELCKALTPAQKENPQMWMDLAVELGYSPAILERAQETQNTQEAIELSRMAWESGDAYGLYLLSSHYQKNYESGAVPTDNVRSYAALFAFTKITVAGMTGHGHGRISSRIVERYERTLDEATAELLPRELEEAISIAKAIITSNPNCCFSM